MRWATNGVGSTESRG